MVNMKIRESFLVQILWDATLEFRRDNGWVMASHLAMSALLSLFPFLICVTSLIGVFEIGVDLDSLTSTLLQTWPESAAEALANEVHSILTTPRTEWLTIGLIVAVWIASSGVEALRVAMNSAYRVEENRSFLYRRLQSIFIVILGSIGLIAFSLLIVLAPILWSSLIHWFPNLETFGGTFDVLRIKIATSLIALCLFVCHSYLPAERHSLRETWPGVIITLFLWLIFGSLFGIYLENFSDYASTYAGLAGIMTALIFLYLISLLFILGGEINGAILRIRRLEN